VFHITVTFLFTHFGGVLNQEQRLTELAIPLSL